MIETRYQLLQFKIIGASSQDPDHPVSLISSETPLQGWHTSRFCSYPQEILIKFLSPVHVRQINLLFHETNIPSKIDFYYYFPSKYNDFFKNYNSLIFDKIGYVEPDSNSRSDYQCREYKRVSIAQNCLYLKLVFHKNISNIYNAFNQVALINLQCFGFVFTKENLQEIFPDKFNRDNQSIYQNPTEIPKLLETKNFDKYIPGPEIKDDEFHKICSDKLSELNKHLGRAKYYDNDDKGKIITDFIEKVRLIGYKVEHLQKLKHLAIDREDYPKAKEIKNEIERMLGLVDEIDPELYRLPTPPKEEVPPLEKISYVHPSPEPSLNEDIRNYRILDADPREKILRHIPEDKSEEKEKEEEDEKEKTSEQKEQGLEKRGFHNVVKPIIQNEEEESMGNNRTFSEEDSIREEMKYKLK